MKTCITILICLPVFLFGCTFSFVYTDISGEQRQLDSFLNDRDKCLQEASVENETGLVCNATIDDIVTPDTRDIESETSKQRAEFIQDFRRKQAARPYPESEAARRESAYIRRSYGRESGPYERRISRDDGRDGLLELESALNSATYQDTGLSLPLWMRV